MNKLILLFFFCSTHCTAQINEYTCLAPVNDWKFVLQLRADSSFKYEAFSKYGRWDLIIGKYKVKKNKLILITLSPDETEKRGISWGEEEQYVTPVTTDTLPNGEVVTKNLAQIKVNKTIPVYWNISSTRPSYFIIAENRLYQQPEKDWPRMDPFFSRKDSSAFDFRKMFQ